MGKILITGGCGYLGAHVSEVLADSGYKVTVLDLQIPGENQVWTGKMEEIILGDIRDVSLINDLSQRGYDVIIHMVSLDHFASQGVPGNVMNVNVLPTWNLLHAFKDKNLKKFIYFSTQQVLGKIPNISIDEKREPLPLNQYGLSHMLSEEIVDFYKRSSGIDCVNIRLSNGYGPPVFKSNNCWWLVVNDLCKSAFIDGRITLQSDGTPQRDFIFVKDIGKSVKAIIEHDDVFDRPVNIGYGQTFTILELAHLVKNVYFREFNKEVDVVFKDGTKSNTAPVGDTEKFKWMTDNLNKIGFKPEVNMESGIKEIFNFLKED